MKRERIDPERVRKLRAQGLTICQIAERLGTSEQNAGRIARELKVGNVQPSRGSKALAQLGYIGLKERL